MNPEAQPAGVGAAESGLIIDQFGNPLVPTGEAYPTTALEGAPQTAPADAGAWTLSSAFGFFNILAGLMLVAAFLMFFGGLSGYLSRLGLEGRSLGLTYMYRGATILFVLILMLAAINYVQYHTATVLALLAIVIVGFGAWAAIQASRAPKEEEH